MCLEAGEIMEIKDGKIKKMIKRVLWKTTLEEVYEGHKKAGVRSALIPGQPETFSGLWTSHATPLPAFPSMIWKEREIHSCSVEPLASTAMLSQEKGGCNLHGESVEKLRLRVSWFPHQWGLADRAAIINNPKSQLLKARVSWPFHTSTSSSLLTRTAPSAVSSVAMAEAGRASKLLIHQTRRDCITSVHVSWSKQVIWPNLSSRGWNICICEANRDYVVVSTSDDLGSPSSTEWQGTTAGGFWG